MIRAAVIPYALGWAHIIVADGPRVLHVGGVEVGRLVAATLPGAKPTRLVGEREAEHVAAALVRTAAEHGAGRIAVEEPSLLSGPVWRAHGELVGRALVRKASEWRLALDVVDTPWRPSTVADAPPLEGWPVGEADRAPARACGWLLAYVDGGGERVSVEVGRGPVRVGVARAAGGVVEDRRPSAPVFETSGGHPAKGNAPAQGSEAFPLPGPSSFPPPAPLPAPVLAIPAGERGLYIDPGGVWTGVVVAVLASPLVALHVDRLPVADWVPLDRPEKRRRRDGTVRVVEQKRELRWGRAGEIAARMVDLARDHGVSHVMIEWVEHAFSAGREGAAAGAMATGLLRAKEVATACRIELERAGFRVNAVNRSTWAAKVAGKANVEGETRSGRIGRAVASAFVNWPEGADANQRDAGGLAVYASLPPVDAPVPRPARVRGDGPVRRVRKPRNTSTPRYQELLVRQREEFAKRRREGGCIGCKGKHVKDCPMFVSKFDRAKKKNNVPNIPIDPSVPDMPDSPACRES